MLRVDLDARLGKLPDEVLELVAVVLVTQQLDQVGEELLRVLGHEPARVAQAGILGVEHVGREQGPKVDDELFGRRHVPLTDGPEHEVGVHPPLNLSLQGRVVIVLREEGFRVGIVVVLEQAEAGVQRIHGR